MLGTFYNFLPPSMSQSVLKTTHAKSRRSLGRAEFDFIDVTCVSLGLMAQFSSALRHSQTSVDCK